MVAAFKHVVKNEGVAALATGLGPTAVGYFIQGILINQREFNFMFLGWFKFGGVEMIKVNMAKYLGVQKSWENK